MTRHRVIALVSALLAVLALGALPAAAADDGQLTWAVAPIEAGEGAPRPNFSFEAEPGQVIHDGIAVTNLGTQPLTLAVYAADALTTSSGQLDLLPAGERSVDLGTWVHLDRDAVKVAAGKTVTVPFTVTVPDDATPGDHSGGVVTSFVANQAGSTVALDSRLGSRMHIRVSGELAPAVAVSGVSVRYQPSANPFGASTATVSYTVTNTGNTRIAATDRVRVTGPQGLAAAQADGALPELLPGDSLVRRVDVAGVWPTGRVFAAAEVLAEGVGGQPLAAVSGSARAWAVPWALAATVAFVVIVALVVPRWRDKRTAKAKSSPAKPAGNSGISAR